MNDDFQNSPSWERVLDDALDKKLSDMHTFLPGRITEINIFASMCSVQPLLKRRYKDGSLVSFPVIPMVPIHIYRTDNAFVSLPIKVGDLVALKFCERALDSFMLGDGSTPVDPEDVRRFSLADAVAYPGFYPVTKPPIGVHPDNLIIRNGLSMIEMTPTGQIALRGAFVETITVLKTLVQTLINANAVLPGTPPTLLPLDPTTLSDLGQLLLALESLEA